MRSGEELQGLLQVLQPANQQVAVLQHQPVASGGSRLQQLEGDLEENQGEEVNCTCLFFGVCGCRGRGAPPLCETLL